MLIHDEETPLDEAQEPTHKESEEVKHCGQPMDTSTNLTREHDYIISRTTGEAVEVSFGPLPSGYVPKNPFASLAQEGYLHAHPEKLGKAKLAEFDAATKGKKLPYKVKKSK
jgi:hypothetical protein